VGPPRDLAALGIPVAADLPVGDGLLEHPGIRYVLEVDDGCARLGWPALAVAARGPGWWAIPGGLDEERGLAWMGFFLSLTDRPHGRISLRSARPDDPPRIDHAFLEVVQDGSLALTADAFAQLLDTDAMRAAGARDAEPDRPLDDRLRAGVTTGTHPAGGCAIGRVVDTRLRVLGIEGLMVVDASVFPRHVSNNPNLTVHAVAERGATFLREDA
jgi:choline dehydrogenase